MGEYSICGLTSNTNITKGYNTFLSVDSVTMKDLEILATLWYFLLKKGKQTLQFNYIFVPAP